MGKSTKATKKFSKRHLSKRVSRRKKDQWINKQKSERHAKLQKSVLLEKDRSLKSSTFNQISRTP